jgi:hypothetical protein
LIEIDVSCYDISIMASMEKLTWYEIWFLNLNLDFAGQTN